MKPVVALRTEIDSSLSRETACVKDRVRPVDRPMKLMKNRTRRQTMDDYPSAYAASFWGSMARTVGLLCSR